MNYRLEHMSMRYGKREALKDFSYTFGTGVYGLIGPNGAGKTTLMQLIAGVFRPTTGRVYFDEEPFDTMSPRYAAHIGYLPQEIVMYPEFTVRQYLEYVAALKKVRDQQQINHLLELVNLSDREKTRCGKLSGGMKRRLGIAQAVLGDPRVLILDEPTTGVDITERVKFRQIISELSADRAVIYSTHTSEDLELVAKEIILMKKGSIVSAGPGAELLRALNGKVWEIRLTAEEFRAAQQNRRDLLVANVALDNEQCLTRILCEACPFEGAHAVPATYEDLSLYIFSGTFPAAGESAAPPAEGV
ncbi:MAG: ATP-binding cassette domain-containing protein [Clostridiales bacterium]|nr:ATP-binding cassette domain-containing protein [Clostridiales bacterium]